MAIAAAGLGVGLGLRYGVMNSSEKSSTTERLVNAIKTENLMAHLKVYSTQAPIDT